MAELPIASRNLGTLRPNIRSELKHEILRKTLHVLIGFTPLLVQVIGQVYTISLLGTGILFYTLSEYFRIIGIRIPLISKLTELSMRDRDRNKFVLGPVTLGLGAMLALLLYPDPAASAAIYALAFGDGLSSLAGKAFGTVKIPGTGGKSVEGSITCFIAVLFSILFLVPSIDPFKASLIALVATALEALPSKDFDNLILPVGTGLLTMLLT